MPKLPEVDVSPEEVHSWLNTAVMTQGAEALERAGYKVTEYARQTDESIVSLGRYIGGMFNDDNIWGGLKGNGLVTGMFGGGGGAKGQAARRNALDAAMLQNAANNEDNYDDAGNYVGPRLRGIGAGVKVLEYGAGREKKTKAPEQGYNTDPIPPDFFDK